MSSSSDKVRNNEYKKTLLTRLLDGVKGCQSRFGSRSELATEDDNSVALLCSAYEDVFSHGFKKNSEESSSSKAAFWVPAALRPSETTSFWSLIKSQLSRHEAERFLLLHHVRSNMGRCRAWIRASLNEHSLERYILIILSLDNLNDFYEEWAFIRDHELNSILPQTAAGLGSVLFALTVDNPKLDEFKHVMEKDVPEATSILSSQDSIEIADQAILALSPDTLADNVPSAALTASTISVAEDITKGKHCKKKKKKVPVNFVSFDDDANDTREPSSDGVSATSSSLYSSLPATAVSTPTDKQSHSFWKEGGGAVDKAPEKNLSGTRVLVSSPLVETKSDNMSEISDNDRDRGVAQDTILVISENESSEPSIETPSRTIPASSALQVDEASRVNSTDPSICSTSVKSMDCISVNSINSDFSERLDMDSESLAGLEISPSQRLKPIANDLGRSSSSMKSITSGGGGGHPDLTHDLIPVPNYDSSQNLDLHLDVDQHNFGGIGCSSSKIQSPVTPSTSRSMALSGDSLSLSNSTMDVANRKDYSLNHDDAVQQLKAILDREIETVTTLRANLAEEKRSSNNQIKILEAKIDSLSKENEILKHQLKKYVGAVQLLKREGSRRLSLDDEDSARNNATLNEIDNAPHEAAEYERKLIQVAEMHGELMEFNSHLQRTIQRKDAAIKRLKEELVDLRGPLASPLMGTEEDDDDDSWDIVESFSSAENARSRSASATVRRLANSHYSNERILINIWIPSAFLTGATNDLHHVYQVFVRIKDTEWNIYRRYSQFYSLHREMSKNDSVISSLYFPPKKHLGNKDAKFVDERRRKLQDYLRAVVNHTLQTNSILASHLEKNLLISILPFFGESFNTQSQKPKRERSRTRSLFFRQSNNSNPISSGQGRQPMLSNYPQYTGL